MIPGGVLTHSLCQDGIVRMLELDDRLNIFGSRLGGFCFSLVCLDEYLGLPAIGVAGKLTKHLIHHHPKSKPKRRRILHEILLKPS